MVSEAEKSPRRLHVLTREKQHQMVVIKRRAASYIAAYDNNQNLDNKAVILVDDVAATGATIIVFARSLKKTEAIDSCAACRNKGDC